jgi:DegV family protein with EDD domain
VSESRKVQVITDSTSDLPLTMRQEFGVEVVPLNISFGNTNYRDGIDLPPETFYTMLQESAELPKTSQPPVTAFEEAFRSALAQERDVVCITISSELSGTFNAARLAAEAVDTERITVVDSRSATMQLGWIVVAAARKANEGGSREDVAAEARDAIGRVGLFAVLRTLDYVYKGGRIGKATQMVGSALAIKPIVSFVDGVLVPLERVRTWKKAVTRVTDLVRPTPSDILVLHSGNLEDATTAANTLQQRYPSASIGIDYAGATIGTYAGPGAIATTALYPRT